MQLWGHLSMIVQYTIIHRACKVVNCILQFGSFFSIFTEIFPLFPADGLQNRKSVPRRAMRNARIRCFFLSSPARFPQNGSKKGGPSPLGQGEYRPLGDGLNKTRPARFVSLFKESTHSSPPYLPAAKRPLFPRHMNTDPFGYSLLSVY